MSRKGIFYQTKFKPEYNISLNPSAPMSGRKHSEETKQILSEARTGKTHSDETKKILSEARTGKNNPMYGKNHSDDTKRKTSDAQPTNIKIEVTDITNNTITSYDSINEAARALKIHKSVIDKYFSRNQTKPYKGKYTFNNIDS